MEITSTTNETTTTLALDGWLDTSTAPILSAEIEKLDPDCEQLILDFTDLEYISSAGLRVLVTAHKTMHGNLTVTNSSPEVMQVLHMTGFDKRINLA
ncbi:MAG: STAS domain-containing protein [Coriobacteriales bacterium]|nr:STAS domain-containing protein [Coriobacteriales bacterium]